MRRRNHFYTERQACQQSKLWFCAGEGLLDQSGDTYHEGTGGVRTGGVDVPRMASKPEAGRLRSHGYYAYGRMNVFWSEEFGVG